MLEIYKSYQETDNQELLIELINHKYILKIIQYQLQSLNTNQIDIIDVQNTLFMYLISRKERLSFEHEYQFKSYLSITTKGIVLNQFKSIQDKAAPHNQEEITYDDYSTETIPTPILDFINQQIPAFKEHLLEGKSLKELSAKYKLSPSTLSVKFKPLKQELRDYYNTHALLY